MVVVELPVQVMACLGSAEEKSVKNMVTAALRLEAQETVFVSFKKEHRIPCFLISSVSC